MCFPCLCARGYNYHYNIAIFITVAFSSVICLCSFVKPGFVARARPF